MEIIDHNTTIKDKQEFKGDKMKKLLKLLETDIVKFGAILTICYAFLNNNTNHIVNSINETNKKLDKIEEKLDKQSNDINSIKVDIAKLTITNNK